MVVFINSFEVPAGRVEEFLDGWHATARHLATQPGYVRTRLHRALSPGTHFRVRLRGRMGVSFRLPVSHQQRGVQRWQWAGTVVICAGAGDLCGVVGTPCRASRGVRGGGAVRPPGRRGQRGWAAPVPVRVPGRPRCRSRGHRSRRPLVLVGQSLGGLIARMYTLKHPDRVAGLVILDTTPEAVAGDPGVKVGFFAPAWRRHCCAASLPSGS